MSGGTGYVVNPPSKRLATDIEARSIDASMFTYTEKQSAQSPRRNISLLTVFLAELLGTFFIFLGLYLGIAQIRSVAIGVPNMVLIGLAFGAMNAIATFVFCNTSAKFNPIVSIVSMVFELVDNPQYMICWFTSGISKQEHTPRSTKMGFIALRTLVELVAQHGGVILSALYVWWIIPSGPGAPTFLGKPLVYPGVSDGAALGAELIAALFIAWASAAAFGLHNRMNNTHGHGSRFATAAIVGFAQTIVVLTTFWASGGVGNWIAYMGAATVSGFDANWWIYLVGSCGAIVGLLIYIFVHKEEEHEVHIPVVKEKEGE
jgi:hypothetical protein